MEIVTIGHTKTAAEWFFDRLKRHGIRRVVDVRLLNTSHLAGFSKRDDLAYFLREICDADYVHEPRLAPSPALVKTILVDAPVVKYCAILKIQDWFFKLCPSRVSVVPAVVVRNPAEL